MVLIEDKTDSVKKSTDNLIHKTFEEKANSYLDRPTYWEKWWL